MAGPGGASPRPADRLRLDKWLWQARFFKTRSLAAAAVETGHIRVNGTPVSRPGRDIAPGDTLTLPQGNRVRLIRILALGARRGPAPEAQALYRDLDAPAAAPPDAPIDA
ncbi:RNA-binding S4 domain-containing protein [Rhodobacter sp. Har01]|uniref:RNA-binding S4 domain-containing protein n=1 Tax=Rhodobacter sp. Har01 TaxID=2883999 RepID=UPI001D072DE1|nr:RNA-binding S4 domain-containing protein [Rhodobacter sp. Har01]MCB6178728.1 RNA-binding S4 domain-containing protein [Rhodobacter sp. Har01]